MKTAKSKTRKHGIKTPKLNEGGKKQMKTKQLLRKYKGKKAKTVNVKLLELLF